MRKLFLTSFCCFVLHFLHAQQYTPAVLINQSGDTVQCEILYKRWGRNPAAISVRGAAKSSYKPGEVRGFTVAGETYVSAFVDLETSPFKLDELDDNANYKYEADTVFLLQLVGGQKSLFFLQDQVGKNHFYVFDKKFVHLDYKQYKKVDDTKTLNSKGIVESRRYLGQLTNYLTCDGLQDRISTTKYEAGALTKLFIKYYECSNDEKSVVKPRHEMVAEMGVVAGAAVTSLTFKGGSAFQYLLKTDYDVSVGPAIGLFVDLKMLRGKGSRVTNDFLYTSFDISGTGQGGGNGAVAYHTTSQFKYQYLKTQHAFQLALAPEGRFYVSGGFTFGFVLNREQQIEIVYDTQTITHPDFKSSSVEYGIVGGAGTNLGRFSIDARYEYSSSLTNVQSLRGNLQRVYLLAKYRLKYKPQL